jgi:hypothetical protein
MGSCSVALGAVIVWRERLLEWVTGADLDGRDVRDANGDERVVGLPGRASGAEVGAANA